MIDTASDAGAESANDTTYRIPKLSRQQQRLMRTLWDLEQRPGSDGKPRGWASMPVPPEATAAAAGLQRREPALARTDRKRKRGFTGPFVGPRTIHLTQQGRAIASRLPPLPPEGAAPLTITECRELLLEIADAVLDHGDTPKPRTIALRVLDALERPVPVDRQ